jgi:hypothetical protein
VVRRIVVAVVPVLAALVCAASGPACAVDPTDAILTRLAAVDPDLRSYKADVDFNVGLHSFPFLRKSLHGSAYFKRPARMEIVFSDLPSYARSFQNLYIGLGTPSDWATKFTITSAEERVGSATERYLVLTPLVADTRLKSVDVHVEDGASLPDLIVWRYTDGSIAMHQHIARVEGHDLVVGQDADIRLPAVHAYVSTRISHYAFNVDVDDRVFTKKSTQAY